MLILTTAETYQMLTEVHGISRELCKHCMNRDVEVYQCDFEGCHICWCTETEPRITPPDE